MVFLQSEACGDERIESDVDSILGCVPAVW